MQKNKYKKTFFTISLLLFITFTINAQSTERFIRIIGNSKKEIKASKSRVTFFISELKENKNKKIEGKSYSEVYNNFISNINKLGFNETDINQSYNKRTSYNKVDSKNFYIDLETNSLDTFTSIKIDGFGVSDIKYLIDISKDNIETDLSLEAIEDANRKAKNICKKIKMKLGKILNIEVKSNDFEGSIIETKQASLIKTYKISVTYKLID